MWHSSITFNSFTGRNEGKRVMGKANCSVTFYCHVDLTFATSAKAVWRTIEIKRQSSFYSGLISWISPRIVDSWIFDCSPQVRRILHINEIQSEWLFPSLSDTSLVENQHNRLYASDKISTGNLGWDRGIAIISRMPLRWYRIQLHIKLEGETFRHYRRHTA